MTTNETYKDDTEVVVYGIYDIVWGGCNFKKECILKDAFDIARKQWNTLDDDMKEYYQFQVLETGTDILILAFDKTDFNI